MLIFFCLLYFNVKRSHSVAWIDQEYTRRCRRCRLRKIPATFFIISSRCSLRRNSAENAKKRQAIKTFALVWLKEMHVSANFISISRRYTRHDTPPGRDFSSIIAFQLFRLCVKNFKWNLILLSFCDRWTHISHQIDLETLAFKLCRLKLMQFHFRKQWPRHIQLNNWLIIETRRRSHMLSPSPPLTFVCLLVSRLMSSRWIAITKAINNNSRTKRAHNTMQSFAHSPRRIYFFSLLLPLFSLLIFHAKSFRLVIENGEKTKRKAKYNRSQSAQLFLSRVQSLIAIVCFLSSFCFDFSLFSPCADKQLQIRRSICSV